ncbi:hypothetical protein BDP55DRAFT_655662 [Colletotrichum godetiae]|uniref:Uncharacterized protein n=1 Tax=Colletotrichum godetiae TaxID=1209918 RepID=A0AAJ0AU08_9PEZI|nr:uncharacterized protein BDP55DRAFT_655662 [Colletotrichum godetiae]KAK1688951.1 hypothetical protein BDP55DRAFT_655662 [Colletotrichum godetiae]
MAKAMELDPSQCKAGLWMTDTPRDLSWCRDCHRPDKASTSSPSDMTLTPSWSWPEIRSTVTWLDANELKWNDYTLEVVKCIEVRQLVVKRHILDVLWDGRVMVLARSRDEADRAALAASSPAARWRSRSPSSIPQTEVVWDESLQPKRQRMRCLEIRSNVVLGRSYGIVLTCDGSSTSRRLGYFKFLHEEVDWHWLHQKRRRLIVLN